MDKLSKQRKGRKNNEYTTKIQEQYPIISCFFLILYQFLETLCYKVMSLHFSLGNSKSVDPFPKDSDQS